MSSRLAFQDQQPSTSPLDRAWRALANATDWISTIRERASDDRGVGIVVRGAAPELEHTAPVSQEAQCQRWRRESMTTGRGTETLDIGAVADDVARGDERRAGQPLQGRSISISRRVYYHLNAQNHAAGALNEVDLARLPALLARPRRVLYDAQRGERRVRHGDLIRPHDRVRSPRSPWKVTRVRAGGARCSMRFLLWPLRWGTLPTAVASRRPAALLALSLVESCQLLRESWFVRKQAQGVLECRLHLARRGAQPAQGPRQVAPCPGVPGR